MIRLLLLLLVQLLFPLLTKAQQASIIGNCFYNNTNQRVVVRIAIRNNTNSATNCQIAAMRVGYQFNETVLTYDGFKSYFYNGTNINSGLNDASFIPGGSFDPENLVTPYNDGTRSAIITSTGGTKTLRKNYFNLSTSNCSELWIIPPNTYRIAFDIYFKLKVGYTPADYNLNTPGYGFGSTNFIAQFIGSLTENLTDPKKEIAMVVITSGQNPYQPFDQNGSTCGSLGVNPVAINDANINFINPVDGVLTSNIENTIIETRANESTLRWEATNNELIESFEIERLNDLNIPTTVTGKLEADKQGGTSTYRFRLPKESFTGTVYYRIKSIGKDGAIQYSRVVKMKNETTEPVMKLWPNPASETVTLQLPLQRGSYVYRIYSAEGKLIHQNVISTFAATIPVNVCSPGLYFVEAVHLETGNRYTGKFRRN